MNAAQICEDWLAKTKDHQALTDSTQKLCGQIILLGDMKFLAGLKDQVSFHNISERRPGSSSILCIGAISK